MSKVIPRYPFYKILLKLFSFSHDFLNKSVGVFDEMEDIQKIKFSDINSLIVVNHPDYIKHVLKNIEIYSRSRVLGNIRPLIAQGIFGSEGALWEQQHRLIKPALHEKMMSEYFDIILTETQWLIRKWEKENNLGKAVHVDKDINVLMLKILIKTQFCQIDNVDYERIIYLLNVFLKETGVKRYFWTGLKDYASRKLRQNKDQQTKVYPTIVELERIIKSILTEARKNPDKKGLVLDILDQAKDENLIDEQQVVDEIKNFILAGFDTTATVLTWGLYSFATEKGEAEKVLEEVSQFELNSKSKIPVTNRFLNEVMRLYPPVHALLRATQKEDEIDGYSIPKDQWVVINVFALHRSKKYWEKPLEFDSSRFLPENFRGKTFTYIPFSQGRRMCLGKALAMAELEYIFPMLVKHFEFEYPEKNPPRLVPDTIIKPKKPLMMVARPRKMDEKQKGRS
jgi:cytochrome P450